jgi:hypothetical protein
MCDQPVCPFLCNGRGTCDPSTRKCDCNKRFTGPDCNIPVCRFGGDSVGLSCSGHGVCVTVGFGLDEIVLCNCVEKYYGENCEKLRCPNDCGARGICVNGKCACDDGFNGDACQYFCPGANSSTSPVSFCAGHGECVLTNRFLSGSSGVQLQSCKCVAGWIGEACDLVGCPGSQDPRANPNALVCSGHGSCDLAKTQCSCTGGYSGLDCAIRPVCPDGCSGHGACIPGVLLANGLLGSPQCLCDMGWSSSLAGGVNNCARNMLGCKNNCSFQGDCVNSQCVC